MHPMTKRNQWGSQLLGDCSPKMVEVEDEWARSAEDNVPQEGCNPTSRPLGAVILCNCLDCLEGVGFSDGQIKCSPNPWQQVSKDSGSRCLVWAALRSCTCNENENVEYDTSGGDTKDNRHNSGVDLPEITGEGRAKKQQCNL